MLRSLGNLTVCCFQTTEWLNDPLQQEESQVQEGRILLEKEERREDDPRGPHEAEGPGSGGKGQEGSLGPQMLFLGCEDTESLWSNLLPAFSFAKTPFAVLFCLLLSYPRVSNPVVREGQV